MLHDSKKIKLFLALLLNAVFFSYLSIWLKHNINLDVFLTDAKLINLSSILITGIAGVVILLIYAKRMALLLDGPYAIGFCVVCLGYGANNLLPFRLGDVIKIYFCKRFYNSSVLRLAFVSLVEKFLDLLIVVMMGFGLLLFGYSVFAHKTIYFMVAVLLAIFMTFFLFKLIRHSGWTIKEHFLKNVMFQKISGAFQQLTVKKQFYKISFYTIAIWVASLFAFYFYFKVNLNESFGLVDALALLFLTTLSFGIPSMPGSLGVFESVITFYLVKFVHVSLSKAAALAVVLHVVFMVPQILFMLIVLLNNRKKILH